jgi:hypothetical protein
VLRPAPATERGDERQTAPNTTARSRPAAAICIVAGSASAISVGRRDVGGAAVGTNLD